MCCGCGQILGLSEGQDCQAQVTFITILFLSLNDDDELTKSMNSTKNYRSEKNSSVGCRAVRFEWWCRF